MHVQVVSDVVCPWCRIGKKNLREAATRFTEQTGEPVEITFLPFLLDPIQPEEEGEGFQERFLKRKGISESQMHEMFNRVTEVGKQFGLTFKFDQVKVAANTVPAHELMELVPEEKRELMMDTMMNGYFEWGANVGDIDMLLKMLPYVVTEQEAKDIEPRLRNHDKREEVLEMIRSVQNSGVSSVPFTIIDGKIAVNGGQPPQAFFNALMQAYEARNQSVG